MSPRATAADVAIWEALVLEATKCVVTPERATVKLEQLAARAKSAVLPRPPYTPENPFIELRRECARFAGLMAATRIKERERLAAALKAVEDAEADRAADGWRNRRDIGG